MRAPAPSRPMLIFAVVCSLIACIERGDPTDPTTPKTPNVITVAVRLPVTSLEVGHVVAAAATPLNSAGEAVPSAQVEWSSSDTTVLTVTSNGQVSGRRMGSAVVYAVSEGVAGQGSLTVTDSVPSNVDVQPQSASAAVGTQVQLAAVVTTKTGRVLSGHPVLWSSTDTRYAVVSSTGSVTGAGAGTARIVARASSVADSATIGVSPAPVAALSITPASSTLSAGATLQLTARATDAAGHVLTGRAVAWASSNTSVASISTSGLATGAHLGSTTITATSEGKRATATITVGAGAVAAVTVSPGSLGLAAGNTQQLSARITDAAGNVLTGQSVSWSTSNSGVGTVSSSGLVTGAQTGTATISATAGGRSGNATLIVSAGTISSVTVSPNTLSLTAGGTRQLSATPKDGSGNVLTGQTIAWSSADPAIGAVSSSGMVTAGHAGTTTITAAAGGMHGTAALTVVAGAVSSVSVTPGSASIVAGATQQFAASAKDGSGNVVSGQTITWSTSNAGVAAVSASGLVTGAHTGTATITAASSGESGSATVAVSTGAVNSVTITPASGSVDVGSTIQLTAQLADVAGNAVTGRTITWTSSSPSHATTSSTGLVTGVAEGSANITAAADGKSRSAAITITTPVVAPPPAPAPPPPSGGTQAVWSDRFVGSVGIATHFNYWDLLPYGNNVNQTIASIQNAGFRFIRDGLSVDVNSGSNDRYWGVMRTLTQQGIKLVLVTQPVYLGNNTWVQYPYTNQSNLDSAVARVGAANILAFEGPNEVDNNNGFWGGIPAFGTNAKAYQAAMYAHSKQIAPSITVIGLTTTSAYGSSFIGDISAYMDAGTLHPYPSGGIPTAALASSETALAVLNGANKPWWVTETGYHTAPNATQMLYQPGVSETAQGKYVARLYLDYFNAGIIHTSVYELIDERSDGTNAEMNYGLLHNDGSPKPAYTALKNMLGLLADPGSTYSPSTLSYSLAGATSTIRHALFQKRDGRFYLVLWNDVSVYDTQAKRDISNAPVPVSLTLGSAHNVAVYQPYTQAAAVSTASNATTLSLSVPDHPLIVEINP
jgi:uncharacterized protein YjdB